MNSVEEAYQVIGGELVFHVKEPWQQVIFQTKIFEKNCSEMTFVSLENTEEKSMELPMSSVFLVSDACIYLRDDLLNTRGDRIWGIKFTLYPTGKFKIDYDYNKPADYEG